MNSPSEDTPKTPAENFQAAAVAAQGKAREAWSVSQSYAKENPLVVIGGALLLGVIIGILCGQQTPRRRETSEIARELVDDVMSQISDRLPKFKKADFCPSALAEQAQRVGQKLKWW